MKVLHSRKIILENVFNWRTIVSVYVAVMLNFS